MRAGSAHLGGEDTDTDLAAFVRADTARADMETAARGALDALTEDTGRPDVAAAVERLNGVLDR